MTPADRAAAQPAAAGSTRNQPRGGAEPAGGGGRSAGEGARPLVVADRDGLRAARDGLAGTVGVVMTMGALHAGHAALLAAARSSCDSVVVTIFVNPLQFAPTEDLSRYPRTFDADLELCRRAGADLVFAPAPEVVYPDGDPAVRVTPGPLAGILEGASRPGHFDGVLTVVLKLLNLTRPHSTFFGAKDFQQLSLVRHMVRDLDVSTDGRPVEIVEVPTVREPDGLALSSRNVYLSADDRRAALALSGALRAGAEAGAAGKGGNAVLAAGRAVLDTEPGIALDYLALTSPQLGPAPRSGAARLLVAAKVGNTRLIDNMPVELAPAGEERA